MMFNFRLVETTTFRGALALVFTDAATGQAVRDHLRIQAYLFDAGAIRQARTMRVAQKSPTSAIYGFRTLPGLERYQRGDDGLAVGSLSYLVTIVDAKNRYLPQVRRYDLPFATPAVQEVTLYPSPMYTPPAAYGMVRGSLLATSAAPNLVGDGMARWASVRVIVPANHPSDPDVIYRGMADENGQFLVCLPYPEIASNVLLSAADWSVDVGIGYEPDVYATELADIEIILPQDNRTRMPLQPTLDGQSDARIFEAVTVVNADEQRYTAINSTTNPISQQLMYGAVLSVRTQIDATPDFLPDLLVVPN